MVEIFKTNVDEVGQSEILISQLLQHFPGSKINFDLEDCDRILRIAERSIVPEVVIALLATQGYHCELLS
jgi:hypothetical protein